LTIPQVVSIECGANQEAAVDDLITISVETLQHILAQPPEEQQETLQQILNELASLEDEEQEPGLHAWEDDLAEGVRRLIVPGGWIYLVNEHPVFISDVSAAAEYVSSMMETYKSAFSTFRGPMPNEVPPLDIPDVPEDEYEDIIGDDTPDKTPVDLLDDLEPEVLVKLLHHYIDEHPEYKLKMRSLGMSLAQKLMS
jgi:hypothetical protein